MLVLPYFKAVAHEQRLSMPRLLATLLGRRPHARTDLPLDRKALAMSETDRERFYRMVRSMPVRPDDWQVRDYPSLTEPNDDAEWVTAVVYPTTRGHVRRLRDIIGNPLEDGNQ